MEEETIYNLIPKEYIPPPKDPKYISRYPCGIPPTGSTFCHKTTSRPNISNLNGDYLLPKGAHENRSLYATLGLTKEMVKPRTSEFMRKGSETLGSVKLMGSVKLPSVRQISCKSVDKALRAPVPDKKEPPIMGLKSNKNFIVANAVENILSAPKVQKEEVDYLKKREFGKVPPYLEKIKSNIMSEYDMIQEMHKQEQEEQEKQRYRLPNEEIILLREGLKKKWEFVNKEYQTITHINKIDTTGLKRKKEECEKELGQLEKDIQKLNKMYIFVDANH